MQLPDGRKSLLHYYQVSGVLAGADFTSGLFLRLRGVNNSCKSRLALNWEDICQTALLMWGVSLA